MSWAARGLRSSTPPPPPPTTSPPPLTLFRRPSRPRRRPPRPRHRPHRPRRRRRQADRSQPINTSDSHPQNQQSSVYSKYTSLLRSRVHHLATTTTTTACSLLISSSISGSCRTSCSLTTIACLFSLMLAVI